MEQESQVEQTNALRVLASTNPKEVGFQIFLLNCYKEAIVFLKNGPDFYG
jgi:hypothetical protein